MGKEKISLGVNVNNFIPYNVLIVDDSPFNLFVLEEVLLNIEEVKVIKRAINGKEALEKVEE